MTEKKDVATEESKTARETKESERAIRPPVDIFEDETGITVQADMPGVSKERLNVHIGNDTLSIEGKTDITIRYQRSFSLSSELDGDKVDASLKDGVLTLRIPKRGQYQPHKIEVRTG
jgi:HSP20 family molecular chaperone IbpA